MTTKTVFFGIMTGDLFGDETIEGIDIEASVEKYAQMCEQAIIKGFAKHSEIVTVEWESQDAVGVTPWGLKTRVDGETDHKDVEFVDCFADYVWQNGKWEVEA